MFLYLFSINVEHTRSILEFCVLVNFRTHQEIRPEVDGGFHQRS